MSGNSKDLGNDGYANTGFGSAKAASPNIGLNAVDGELDNILAQLGTTIGALEGVVDVQLENKVANQEFAAQVQRMGADRVRLAGSLDDAEARCQRLESVNREVSSRLVNAMETIRSVLDKSSG